MTAPGRMPLAGAVAVVRDRRGPDDLVVSSMGNAREWMALGPLHALDLVLVPSAMGHATSMGLGLALAQPARRVFVLSGDGSLLMNLGSLVTIAAEAPANLVVVVFVNGVYEVTGAQPMPGAGRVDFVAMARASGIPSVFRWTTLDAWDAGFAAAIAAVGPTVVVLEVEPVPEGGGPKSPGPTRARGPALMAALAHRPGQVLSVPEHPAVDPPD